jgi:integrase
MLVTASPTSAQLLALPRNRNTLANDPGEDVSKPQTKSVERPVMTREQILSLLGAINDVHDLCLLCVGIFCGPRASEVMGMQWKSWNGESPTKASFTWADSRQAE